MFGPRGAARALSLIAMLMALAPAIAPGLGGLMLRYVPWPSVFFFLAGYGFAVLLIVVCRIPETLPVAQSLRPRAIAANYAQLLRDPVFLPVASASALVYSGLMAYLACSGFVFIDMLGVPTEYFGLIFLTSVAGYMGGSAFSARLAARRPPARVLFAGVRLALLSTLLMLALHSLWPPSVLALIVPMALYAAALGLTLPQAMAMAMENFPRIAATNSSLFGFLQMGLSALITALVGLVLVATPMPMIVTMLVIDCFALLLVIYARRRAPRQPPFDSVTETLQP